MFPLVSLTSLLGLGECGESAFSVWRLPLMGVCHPVPLTARLALCERVASIDFSSIDFSSINFWHFVNVFPPVSPTARLALCECVASAFYG
mgnify:CR=1 FL=1